MPTPLDFQIGFVNGSAVGYCPTTGHVVDVPLRDVARQLHARGHIDSVGADLLDELDTLHDSTVIDGFNIGGMEIGASKSRKAKRKARRTKRRAKIKKAVKKVGHAAKKFVKSKLGKAVLLGGALFTGGATATALLAHHKGKKVKKHAASGNAKKGAAVDLGNAVSDGSMTPDAAAAAADAQGVSSADVAAVASSNQTEAAAQQGDMDAQAIVDASDAVDNATVSPLGGATTDDDMSPQDATDLPDPEFAEDDSIESDATELDEPSDDDGGDDESVGYDGALYDRDHVY